MNDFGNFLYELRKEKSMTQAELAQELGVTNKAVSKWETGEAMPETALLSPLSRIFGVTVDELLAGRREAQEENTTEKDDPEKHLFENGKDETKLEKVSGAVCACLVLCGVAAYVLSGALTGLWHPLWIIVVCCALGSGIVGILFGFFDREKREKLKAENRNIYAEGACGIIMLLCIITYLCLGALLNLWHPYWIIVVAGAAVAGIIGAVSKIISLKNKKTNS